MHHVIYIVRRKAQVKIFTFFANIWYFSLLQFWIRNILNVLQFRYIQHFLLISSFEKFWKIFDVVKYFVPSGYVQTENLELNTKQKKFYSFVSFGCLKALIIMIWRNWTFYREECIVKVIFKIRSKKRLKNKKKQIKLSTLFLDSQLYRNKLLN